MVASQKKGGGGEKKKGSIYLVCVCVCVLQLYSVSRDVTHLMNLGDLLITELQRVQWQFRSCVTGVAILRVTLVEIT